MSTLSNKIQQIAEKEVPVKKLRGHDKNIPLRRFFINAVTTALKDRELLQEAMKELGEKDDTPQDWNLLNELAKKDKVNKDLRLSLNISLDYIKALKSKISELEQSLLKYHQRDSLNRPMDF